MLAQLGLLRIFEQGLERGEHVVATQLRRRTGILVRDRHIRGVAGLDRERYTDNLRAHRIETGGFGVDADQFGDAEFFQPGVEVFPGEDEFVIAFGVCALPFKGRVGWGWCCRVVDCPHPPFGHLPPLRRGRKILIQFP